VQRVATYLLYKHVDANDAEGGVARELPQQPPRPAAEQLPHDARPPGRG